MDTRQTRPFEGDIEKTGSMPNIVLKDGEAEIRLHQFMEEPAVSFYADQVLVEEVPNGYKVVGV